MFAIATLLDPNSDAQTREFWQLLQKDCGLAGINTTPLPHFSWQGADDYPVPEVERMLKGITRRMAPFKAQTAGLGLFTGPTPVLYLALVKTARLMEVHRSLWETIGPLGDGVNSHYSPDAWMPHITIAYQDLGADNLACAVKNLIFKPVELNIQVDQFALLYQNEEDTGVTGSFPFGGNA
jgi:2'-5' RNA ligase